MLSARSTLIIEIDIFISIASFFKTSAISLLRLAIVFITCLTNRSSCLRATSSSVSISAPGELIEDFEELSVLLSEDVLLIVALEQRA